MNFLNILQEIEKVDPEMFDRFDTRRKAMSEFANMGKKIALASLPLAAGSMFKKAYGQGSRTVTDVLKYALLLERLEYAFYKKGLEDLPASSIPTPAAKAALETIRNHEQAHVAFLEGALGAEAGTAPAFDFTAGGTFPTVFSDYQLFLAVAQTFEDTGVRAYKGQVQYLTANTANDVLTAAVQIHSVEARHASHIRQMRKAAAGGGAMIDPWITQKVTGIGSTAVDASYAGEENTNQAGVVITTLDGVGGKISADAATEAFDEPLTEAQVTSIVTPFLA